MTETEVWRPVVGFSGYEVSDLGRVRSWRPGKWKNRALPALLAGGRNTSGYRHVCLSTGAGQRVVAVHVLVAAAFLGPKPPPPAGAVRIEICHRNGDQIDNRAVNLRYGTPKQNSADSIAHGTHTSIGQKSKTHCKRGHEFTPTNTAMRPTMKGILVRCCRKCGAMKQREYQARKKNVGADS